MTSSIKLFTQTCNNTIPATQLVCAPMQCIQATPQIAVSAMCIPGNANPVTVSVYLGSCSGFLLDSLDIANNSCQATPNTGGAVDIGSVLPYCSMSYCIINHTTRLT